MRKRFYTNSEDTLLVISNFAHSRLFDSQKALKRLAKKQQILVLAQQVGKKQRHFEQKNLFVDRVWTKDKPLSLLKLFPFLMKNNRIKNVLFQFNFRMFGRNLWINIFIPVILMLLKWYKKRVYFEFHQVYDEKRISKNMVIKRKIRRAVYNQLLSYFYKSIATQANYTIVFKPSLHQILAKFVSKDDILLLPSTLVRLGYAKRLNRLLKMYKRIVTTPYDISPNILLNLK